MTIMDSKFKNSYSNQFLTLLNLYFTGFYLCSPVLSTNDKNYYFVQNN